MPKVKVTIHDDGSVKPDFLGFEGDACVTADLQLRTRLAQFGITLEEVHITPKPELLAAQSEKQAIAHQHLQELQEG